ncbi:MAG: hypothetical protein GDA41_08845 [Rhodospirillales bacterium]|nr:hypothetical protein [Rhodospirillales bacterium]
MFSNKGRGLILTFTRPMIRAGLLAAIRSYGGFPAYAGMELLPFIVTGVLCSRFFRRTSTTLIGAAESGKSLLSFYQVSELDLYLTRFIAGLSINLTVAFILYFILRIIGAPPVAEPLYMIIVLIFVTCLGFAVGLVLASLAIFLPPLKSVSRFALRGLRLTSGSFFVVPEIPAGLRDYFLWNPLLHVSELARTYYFVQYNTDYGDWNYLIKVFVITLFLGLILERISRHRIGRGI